MLAKMDIQTKHSIDVASVTVTVATVMSWLPSIASLLTVIWLAIRIYETRTVQKWLGKEPPKERSGDE